MTAFTQVDAFTDEPFKGNPAAVFVLAEERDAGWMQRVAAEMNLAETAFLRRRDDGFALRWFTPLCEVELCGHATLASAHALFEQNLAAGGEIIRFHTLSGVLTARRDGSWIELDFPRESPQEAEVSDALRQAIGSEILYAGKNRFDYLIELPSERDVIDYVPDLGAFRNLDARGVIITAPAERTGIDFVSRFFGPAVGVDEDPVTGSAHCCLAPYWGAKLGREEMVGYQASRRGGVVRVRNRGNRVLLGGQAVTVVSGELLA